MHATSSTSAPPTSSAAVPAAVPTPSAIGDGRHEGNQPYPPLRVLLWSVKGAGLRYGGPGTSAYRLYSRSRPGQFEITLAHGMPDQIRYPLFRAEHLVHPFHTRTLAQVRFLQASRAWVREHARGFDVFHGLQAFEPTVTPAVEAERCGLPAFVKPAAWRTDLADKPGWRARLGVTRRRRRRVRSLSGIIAISNLIAEELRSYGIPESKIACIPNGVDTDHFRPVANEDEKRRLRAQLGWPTDRVILLFVGAIIERKQPHCLLDAVHAAQRRGGDLGLHLVLVGPEYESAYAAGMRRRARELGIEGRITWAGYLENVADALRAADVYALISTSEGMPNALLEAMATGLPCVASAISGVTDIIDADDGNGVRIDLEASNWPGAVTEAILQAVEHADRRGAQGHAARRTVLDRFSADAVLAAHEAMFRRVLAGGTAAP